MTLKNIEADFEALEAIAIETDRLVAKAGKCLSRVHESMTFDELLAEAERNNVPVKPTVTYHGLVDRLRKSNTEIVNQVLGPDHTKWSPFLRQIHERTGDYFTRKRFPPVEGLITQAVLATARNAHNWFHHRSEQVKSWEGRLRGLLRTLPDFVLLTSRNLESPSPSEKDASDVPTREHAPEKAASDNESLRQIVAQMGLTPDEFQVLCLCVLNRVPPRIASVELNRSTQEVYRLNAKAKKKLKAFMRTIAGSHADLRWMYVIEGKTVESIATSMRISVEEVRCRLQESNTFPFGFPR